MFLEMAKLLAELNCNCVKEVKSLVGVHAQLCESMPLCTGKEQSQNIFIIWLWEEGLKYGDGALIRQIRVIEKSKKRYGGVPEEDLRSPEQPSSSFQRHLKKTFGWYRGQRSE
jgi:hypothetical protein